MEPFLSQQRDGPVVTVTLDRPETRNAITDPEQSREFVDFCDKMASDPTVRCIVLTGAGKSFCAGGNVKQMRDREGMFGGSPFEQRTAYRTTVQTIGNALYNLEVPVVAAINGHAIGLGFDLTLMCDIRIVAQGAVLAESYVKLGIIPGGGGAWLLPRAVGQARASQMILTGDAIDAETALSWGLVSEVLPPEELRPRAQAIAQSIAANPGHATRLAKRLVREGMDQKLPTHLEMAAAFQPLAHHTADHGEAIDAFLEKRPPAYKDR